MAISNVAIVGAGLSGLVCAGILSENGIKVTVFDKGRFPGGRLASRDRDEHTFDYGAQYFTVRDSIFKQLIGRLEGRGKTSRWDGKFARMAGGCLTEETIFESRYVGTPLMRSIADSLASSLDCRTSHRVTGVLRQDAKWSLTGTVDDALEQKSFSLGDFDFLVLSLPPLQAAALYPHSELEAIIFRPCSALLIAFEDRVKLDFDGVKIDDEVISWVARDSSKPGRPPGERWVIHASPWWSEAHFEADKDEIQSQLIERYATIFSVHVPDVVFSKVHNWKYALPVSPPQSGCIFDRDLSLAYSGDWCLGARVEGAFLSGVSAAEQIMRARALQ